MPEGGEEERTVQCVGEEGGVVVCCAVGEGGQCVTLLGSVGVVVRATSSYMTKLNNTHCGANS